MSDKIKIKGWEFVKYGTPKKEEWYIEEGGIMKQAPRDFSSMSIPIFKPKTKKKWVNATKELIQSQGHKWGEPVPCRVRDYDSDEWIKANLIDIEKSPMQYYADEYWWEYCQIKIEVEK